MQHSVLRIVYILILLIVPFSGILNQYSLGSANYTLISYLMTCVGFAILFAVMAMLLHRSRLHFQGNGPKFVIPAWCLWLVGPFIMVSFNLPEPNSALFWMGTPEEETARYTTLIIAAIICWFGVAILYKQWTGPVTTFERGVFALFTLGVIAVVYDFYIYMQIPAKILAWTQNGQDLNSFMKAYDFNDGFRALARSLIYASAGGLLIALQRRNIVKEWFVYCVSMFCLLGVFFALRHGFFNLTYYYPFLVPAVCFIPFYTIGVYLLATRAQQRSTAKESISENAIVG
jgi:hypothetical protein